MDLCVKWYHSIYTLLLIGFFDHAQIGYRLQQVQVSLCHVDVSIWIYLKMTLMDIAPPILNKLCSKKRLATRWYICIYIYCHHYIDVIMTTVASQITSLTVVNSIVYSGADQIKKNSKHRATGIYAGKSPGPVNPRTEASNAENGSIWWRHHDSCLTRIHLDMPYRALIQ